MMTMKPSDISTLYGASASTADVSAAVPAATETATVNT